MSRHRKAGRPRAASSRASHWQFERLEHRVLLHGGVDDGGSDAELPAWHLLEHQLSAAGAGVNVPPPLPQTTFTLASLADERATVGEWGGVMSWPSVAIHSFMLPSGKVLFWPVGADTQLWDPTTNTLTDVSDPAFNAFCAGHAFLADGRLLVVGGHIQNGVGLPNAAVYNPFDDTWTELPDMNAGRWYPNATTLGDGSVSVSGGTTTGYGDYDPLPQVWQADGSGWRDLTTALRVHDYYPDTYLTAAGQVYYAGPSNNTFSLDPSGTGSWSEGPARVGGGRSYGSGVMYDDGKILIAGGNDPPKATAEVIDLNTAAPKWRAVGSMAFQRRMMNATILPDGQVLVTGGVSGDGFNNRSTPVYNAEMWNPQTEQFTTMASMSAPRWYHSTALLLPDGRVLTAGGDDTPSGQVYSPPYLFKGPRPTIDAAPDVVTWGQSFDVSTADASNIAAVNLIRMGTVTHSFNYDQRINHLSFTQTANGLHVTSPQQPNLAPPGYYMLFIVDGNGVPSVSKILRVGVPDGAVQSPFGGSAAVVPGTIEAENYDAGGVWLAMHDTTPGNAGGAYRNNPGDDVDVYAAADASNGNHVSDLAAGEWMEYTVNVSTGGAYAVAARLAAGLGQGGTFHLEIDGYNKSGSKSLAAGNNQLQDVALATVALTPGTHVVRFQVDSANGAGFGRFDRLTFAVAPDAAPTLVHPASAVASVTGVGAPLGLSALGADDLGEANLKYTWSTIAKPVGTADPTFSVNGSNAAKQTAVTFGSLGSYTLRVTIADAGGQSVVSDVVVKVETVLSTTLRAGDDAYGRGGTYAGQNFGSDTALVVKHSTDASSTRESYLRFDLAPLAGSTITKATLRMTSGASAADNVPVALHAANSINWTESSLTWNNRPGFAVAALGTASIAPPINGKDGTYDFDVTSFLAAQNSAGATAAAFAIEATADTNSAAIFKSDEYSGAKPQLIVEYAPGAPPPPALVVTPSQISVPEGSGTPFTIQLASAPDADVLVAVARQSGDADLTTSLDAPLTFTTDNWNTPQSVLISGAQDADQSNGSAVFAVSAPGTATKTVTATEADDDAPALEQLALPAVADAYVRDGTYAKNNFGNDAQLIVKKSANSSNTRETYLRFDLSGVGTVSSGLLRVYGGLQSSGTGVAMSLYPVSSTTWAETSITWNNKPSAATSALGGTTVGSTARQWYEFDVSSYLQQLKAAGAVAAAFALKATNTTDPQAAFDSGEASSTTTRPVLLVQHLPAQSLVVSAAAVSVPEGSNKTFTVRLSRKPAADVVVNVSRTSGDADLSATPASLTFTSGDWDQPKTVTVAAAEDADTTSGSAVFSITSAGLPTKTVTAAETDNDLPVGPLVFRAAADAYVRDGSYATTNFGSATELQIKKNATSGYTRETWLRFDLSTLAGATSAKLRLNGKLSEALAGGMTVTVSSSTNTTWGESSLTWNARPAAGTTTLASANVSGTTAKWFEWDLSGFVKSELAAGRKVITLVLRSTTPSNATATFSSDEASATTNRPELDVTP